MRLLLTALLFILVRTAAWAVTTSLYGPIQCSTGILCALGVLTLDQGVTGSREAQLANLATLSTAYKTQPVFGAWPSLASAGAGALENGRALSSIGPTIYLYTGGACQANSANVACSATGGSLTTYTFTPPPNLVYALVYGCGMGGPGGSGAVQVSATTASSGGGGGGAGICGSRLYTRYDIGQCLKITIPAAAAGGTAVTASVATNGNTPSQGGNTTVTNCAATVTPMILYPGGVGAGGFDAATVSAGGGSAGICGAGGNASGSTGGSAGCGFGSSGGAGAAGSNANGYLIGGAGAGTSAAGAANGGGTAASYGPGGGSSGGGVTSSAGANAGVAGGQSISCITNTPTGGSAGTPNGGVGNALLLLDPGCGAGSGWGGPKATALAGTGGAGINGSGGGGGGSCEATSGGCTSGAGGAGGNAFVAIIPY